MNLFSKGFCLLGSCPREVWYVYRPFRNASSGHYLRVCSKITRPLRLNMADESQNRIVEFDDTMSWQTICLPCLLYEFPSVGNIILEFHGNCVQLYI